MGGRIDLSKFQWLFLEVLKGHLTINLVVGRNYSVGLHHLTHVYVSFLLCICILLRRLWVICITHNIEIDLRWFMIRRRGGLLIEVFFLLLLKVFDIVSFNVGHGRFNLVTRRHGGVLLPTSDVIVQDNFMANYCRL